MKIGRTNYNVEAYYTVDAIAETAPRTAALMRENGWIADMIVRRPNGRVSYLAREDVNGRFSIITRL